MPDCGGIYTLPRLVGSAQARAMTLLASPVNAQRAQQLGLIWRVIDDHELESETPDVVERLLQAAPLALAATNAYTETAKDWILRRCWRSKRRISNASPVARLCRGHQGVL
jgi:2-(1,2-epoxy-1,2-dihydrophenyl)acetyl-CoA isomerase